MEDKTFKTLDEQVEILKSRNMRFKDEESAKYVLINNSYYGIINSYKELFQQNKSEESVDYGNQLFEEVLEDTLLVGDFDKSLASILYKYIMMIETTFKSSLSYYISLELGSDQQRYLDKNNYSNGYVIQTGAFKGSYSIEKTFDKIATRIDDSRVAPIRHFRENYGNVPPWIVIPTLSLGVVYEWYKLCRPSIKRSVANIFLYPQKPDELKKELFLQAMKTVHLYRNIVAHGSRLMIHETPLKTRLKERLLKEYLQDAAFSSAYIYERSYRVFALFVSICLLFSNRNQIKSDFINDLEKLFEELERKNKRIYDLLLYRVYLPRNFIELLREI
ncbi:Abi family protein [Enterococcus sp. BWR-S5]|uniref:Abi family protein n=1 Tax=Enterococcus sp. BWR-S5 TaxID=2787714 RepID=UPI001921F1FE|nr:Abi family protein [Enterococcus sp. BWR-S5]MBL1226983.1 Abi family protein [Enterococcus sp. BWR-S5]